MYRIGIFFLMLLLGVTSQAWAGKARCPDLSATLVGSTTNMGVVYTERLTLSKVSGGGGYDGKWLVEELEQQIDYPWDLNAGVPTTSGRIDMGLGMWMNNFSRQQGPRTLLITSTAGNYQLDVVGGKIGLVATNRFSGSISGDEMTFKFDSPNPNEPTLKGKIMRGGSSDMEMTIAIMNDADEGKFVYSTDTPATFKLILEARVSPPDHAGDVEWTLPEIAGSVRLVQPVDARGPYVTATYKLLPSSNDAFGNKTVTAKLKAGSCKVEESKNIKVFFPANAENNPGGRDPNWFYYWKQTPAGKPNGQIVKLIYGGHPYSFCYWENESVTGFFDPKAYSHRTAFICNLAQLSPTMSNRFPLIWREQPGNQPMSDGFRTTTFIDTFATLVLHEFAHIGMFERWKMGKSLAQLQAEDSDGDGVPSLIEPEYGFDPAKKQTFYDFGEYKKIKWDEEWLAYEAMKDFQPGKLDKLDWAKPGKQWP